MVKLKHKKLIATIYPLLDQMDLLDSQKKFIKERFMPDGKERMSLDAVAEHFGISYHAAWARQAAIFKAIDKQIEKEKEKQEKLEVLPVPEPPTYPSSRVHAPWYRINGGYFETLDLVLATALMTLGYRFVEVREPEGTGYKKRIVIDIGNDNIIPIIENFMNQSLLVDASTFHSRLKIVKTALYTAYNNR